MLIIKMAGIGFYLAGTVVNTYTDCNVAQYLNMSLNEYRDILLENRAFKHGDDHYFYKYCDAERALEALEPYIIMVELTR